MALSGKAEQTVIEPEIENDPDKCALLDLAVTRTLDSRSQTQQERGTFETGQTTAIGSL
jgi:hypothetical protein